jgi:hypothetical protein
MDNDKPWFNAHDYDPWANKSPFTPFKLSEDIKPSWEQPKLNGKHYTSAPVGIDDPGRHLELEVARPPIEIPGLVGEIVNYCWNAASSQLAEVAVASALSLMSLLCSRAYRHGTLGLNMYLLVLAQTSMGKSFGFQSNDYLINALQKHYEQIKPPHWAEAQKRVEATKKMIVDAFGSAQGLQQHIPNSPSTLWHADEFVNAIKLMSQPFPPPHIQQLRDELLKLTEKSGPGRVYRAAKYSKRSSTAQAEIDVYMASLTILATGTPEAFYDDLNSTLLTYGFLPRFTVFEYTGSMPAKNANPISTPTKSLMDKLITLFDHTFNISLTINHQTSVEDITDVVANPAARDKLNWVENYCMREVVKAQANNLPTSGVWTRAKEHTAQIASLIAIGCNPYMPTIDRQHVDIAWKIVSNGVARLTGKVAKGETGEGDSRLVSEIRKQIARMYVGGYEKFKGYPMIKKELIDAGIIQISAVKNYCRVLAVFRRHKLGETRAFDDAYNSMLRDGEITRHIIEGSRIECVKLNMEIFEPIISQL